MIDLEKVAKDIKDDSLYNTILFDVKEKLEIDNPSLDEIENLLKNDEELLQEYRNINRYSELSSIHAKELKIEDNDKEEIINIKKEINKNVSKLKALENFSVDSSGSAYEIWIGSVGVMVVFMMHNVFALFTDLYVTHGLYIYTLFSGVLFLTYYAYKKVKRNHENKFIDYKKLYKSTEELIDKALNNRVIIRSDLY